MQKLSEKPVITCPGCGKDVKRVISQTNFSLKGDGWYKDGYSTKPEVKKDSAKKADTKPCESGACAKCPHAKKVED